jgi:hypothetical protein
MAVNNIHPGISTALTRMLLLRFLTLLYLVGCALLLVSPVDGARSPVGGRDEVAPRQVEYRSSHAHDAREVRAWSAR